MKSGNLVLGRKPGQSVVISGPAKVTVRKATHLEVQADKKTLVLRGELDGADQLLASTLHPVFEQSTAAGTETEKV